MTEHGKPAQSGDGHGNLTWTTTAHEHEVCSNGGRVAIQLVRRPEIRRDRQGGVPSGDEQFRRIELLDLVDPS